MPLAWPTNDIVIPAHWLQDRTMPPPALETALMLRALGRTSQGVCATPPFHPDDFKALTGKGQATLYQHLALLRARGWCRSRPARRGTGQIVVEFPAGEDSGNLEHSRNLENSPGLNAPDFGAKPRFSGNLEHSRKPESASLKTQDSVVKNTKRVKDDDSGKLENSGAGTRAIQEAYERLLGRRLPRWNDGEATAAREIGGAFSVMQLEEAYRHYKAQAFWSDKRLSLRYLATHMPDYFAAKAAGALGPAATGLTRAQAVIVADLRKRGLDGNRD